MKQTLAKISCIQALFLCFLCVDKAMVHSEWLSQLYGVAKSPQAASLFKNISYCCVCCRPGCLTMLEKSLLATIFDGSLSLVLFWFYCSFSATRSIHLLTFIHFPLIRHYIHHVPPLDRPFSFSLPFFLENYPISCRIRSSLSSSNPASSRLCGS